MQSTEQMEITVVGAGGWGTAVSRLLANRGHQVHLWVRDKRLAERIDRERVNEKYLAGVALPQKGLEVFTELAEVAGHGELFLMAVPSFAMREGCERIANLSPVDRKQSTVFISLAKGVEQDRFLTMSEVLVEVLDVEPEQVFALSGPSHAEEVGRDVPTTVVLAGRDLETGERLQRALMTDRFRVYLSDDIRGVEYAAAIKNVIALACGISDGLGYGDNSKGALISRGLAEMVRLADYLSVRRETFFGIAGLGDLVTTCISEHSRNRYVGQRIGKGETLVQIQHDMTMVAEGIYATRAIHRMAQARGIEMPITAAVYDILYQGADPLNKVDEMMTREPKVERL
ncbi:MAG: NAD(P)H-dependent glycerol-3-phosphate dehydrogenase [Candidatus Bipolaricaulia bacterium]